MQDKYEPVNCLYFWIKKKKYIANVQAGYMSKSSCYVQKLNVNVKENDMKGLATM